MSKINKHRKLTYYGGVEFDSTKYFKVCNLEILFSNYE